MTIKQFKFNELVSNTPKIRGIPTNEYKSMGSYPVIDQGIKFIAGYSDNENSLYKDTLPVVVFGDHTLSIKYLDFPFCAGADGVQILKPNTDVITGKFLYYAIMNLNIQSLGYSRHFKVLKKSIFYVPDIEEQHRIVKILDLAQSLIEKRKQAISHLDDYIKAVFLDMFGDPVSNPKGWGKNVFGDLCYRLSDGPFGSKLKTEHYSNAGMRVIRLQNIGIGKFKDENKSFIKNTHYERELVNYTCHAGEIVIATLGEPNIRACKIPEAIKKAVNKADCIHCIPVEILNKDYLIALLNLPEFHTIFTNYIHGQTRSRVSVGQLKKIMIPVPPTELQRKFSAIAEKTEKIKQKMQTQLKELEDNFQAQLQRAFRGESV